MSKRNTTGIGPDGKSNALARKGEAILTPHHGPALARNQEAQQHTRATLGKAPKPKGYEISIHDGMSDRQKALQGMQHANAGAPDANPASPLSKEPAGKAFVGKCAPISPGTRSRTNAGHSGMTPDDLGSAIMAEAVCNK